MKVFGCSYIGLICILFLMLSPCDVNSMFSNRRRRYLTSRDGGFEEGKRRETHPSERKCEPESSNPTYGSVSCTNGNNHKSVCDYTCDEGYQLSDPEDCSRFCDGQKWSRDEPVCKAIKSQ